MDHQQIFVERTTHMGSSDEIIFCKIQEKRQLQQCADLHKHNHDLHIRIR